MAKKIILLGATGSIGSQALLLLKDNKDYELVGISANSNGEKLIEIAKEFPSVRYIAIATPSKAKEIEDALPAVKVLSGESANIKIVDEADPEVVLNSILGFCGFLPSLHALNKDKILLLANKETLVVGGAFIQEALKKGKGELYPIDSEHVALAKCLADVPPGKTIKKLFITASGGALRDYPPKDIGKAPVSAVLKHPTWHMGAKITVDSATMVNKAYEVIEASMLFNRPLKDIKAVIQRESLIHAGVELDDGTTIVEYSPNTMLIPIKYALSRGTEKRHQITEDDEKIIKTLKYEEIDKNRYPMFYFIIELVGKFPSRAPIIINAVDEVVVHAYLNNDIRLGDLETILRKVSSRLAHETKNPSSLKDVLVLDETSRNEATKMVHIFSTALKNGNNPSDVVAKPLRDANRKHDEDLLSKEEKAREKKASRWKNDPTKKALLREHQKQKKATSGYPKKKRKEKDFLKKPQSFGAFMEQKDEGRHNTRGERRSSYERKKKGFPSKRRDSAKGLDHPTNGKDQRRFERKNKGGSHNPFGHPSFNKKDKGERKDRRTKENRSFHSPSSDAPHSSKKHWGSRPSDKNNERKEGFEKKKKRPFHRGRTNYHRG